MNFFPHSVCCFKLFWSHSFWQTLKKDEDSISSTIFSQCPPFFGLESTVPREIFEKHFSFMMIIIVITRVEDWAVSQNVVNFLHPSSTELHRVWPEKNGLAFLDQPYKGTIKVAQCCCRKGENLCPSFFGSDLILHDLTSRDEFNSLV